MRRLLKGAAWGLGGLSALALLAGLGAFGVSEAMIRWPVAGPQARAPAVVRQGAHRAVQGAGVPVDAPGDAKVVKKQMGI